MLFKDRLSFDQKSQPTGRTASMSFSFCDFLRGSKKTPLSALMLMALTAPCAATPDLAGLEKDSAAFEQTLTAKAAAFEDDLVGLEQRVSALEARPKVVEIVPAGPTEQATTLPSFVCTHLPSDGEGWGGSLKEKAKEIASSIQEQTIELKEDFEEYEVFNSDPRNLAYYIKYAFKDSAQVSALLARVQLPQKLFKNQIPHPAQGSIERLHESLTRQGTLSFQGTPQMNLKAVHTAWGGEKPTLEDFLQ
jgi:hypothetical protein